MPWGAVARRGALLFAIGVALNWCLRPGFDWDQLRWAGVLQRIAIVYLACAVIVSVGRGAIVPLGLGLAIIATHTFVLLNIGAENTVASLAPGAGISGRSEEHTSELQSLMRISYAVFCLNKKIHNNR